MQQWSTLLLLRIVHIVATWWLPHTSHLPWKDFWKGTYKKWIAAVLFNSIVYKLLLYRKFLGDLASLVSAVVSATRWNRCSCESSNCTTQPSPSFQFDASSIEVASFGLEQPHRFLNLTDEMLLRQKAFGRFSKNKTTHIYFWFPYQWYPFSWKYPGPWYILIPRNGPQ